MAAKFPVFPAIAGISSIFPAQPPFGRENSEANQALASQFPSHHEPGIHAGQSGIKLAEPGIIPN
jgi:hypothetical protein